MRLRRQVDPRAGVPVLPEAGVERILILRTAQLREVQWARDELARRYPKATFGILGTRLAALGAFEDCARFEVAEGWLTPASVRPLLTAVAAFAPDMVVLCMNNDWRVGYDRSSRVVKGIHAPHKVVAGYNRRWSHWRHEDFAEDGRVTRWLVEAAGLLILAPMMAAYLLLKPAGPVYAGTPARGPRAGGGA
ncbi:MAG: hypothetical protein AB7P67_12845 [Vicinamibacterales bacterium]